MGFIICWRTIKIQNYSTGATSKRFLTATTNQGFTMGGRYGAWVYSTYGIRYLWKKTAVSSSDYIRFFLYHSQKIPIPFWTLTFGEYPRSLLAFEMSA